MRSVIKKIVQILDGTPAVYGKNHARGQSVVELALVSPILIVLIMGLVEIAWFANNYLILLETTRVGARYGTVQTGDTSPQEWNNLASISPNLSPPTDTTLLNYRNCASVNQQAIYQGFYSILSCIMLNSMAPLEFHSRTYNQGSIVDPYHTPPADGRPEVDDIVISVFSLQLVDPLEVPASIKPNLQQVSAALTDKPQVIVVGRYPTNANECNSGPNQDPRDPFDYIKDSKRNFSYDASVDPSLEINRNYLELEGYDGGSETQRGFDLTGRHVISNSGGACYGSEWSIGQVQDLVNLPNFSLIKTEERARLASQGMVLVEMFWRHYLLLKNPVFNPVFTILGDQTIISVWSAFPVPAAEPRIKFPKAPPAFLLGGA